MEKTESWNWCDACGRRGDFSYGLCSRCRDRAPSELEVRADAYDMGDDECPALARLLRRGIRP